MWDAIATKRSRGLMLVAVGLLAAAAVLPLLVPPSAVAWELLPLEDRLALESTEISSAKVCGAGECREVSDPEAARALAVGPTPRGTDAPVRGLPWYKSTLTIPAEGGGEVDRVSVSVTVVPSAGLMRVEDGVDGVWVTLPSESKEAYAKLTAGLTPRPARTLPSVGADALAGRPRRRGRRPERGHPGGGERRLDRLDRRAGRRRASGAHGGVAAQHPPPPRVDAASGARGTGVGTVRSGPDVHQGPGHFGIRRCSCFRLIATLRRSTFLLDRRAICPRALSKKPRTAPPDG